MFDETAAQLAFQSVAGAHSMLSVIRDLVIPYVHDIGERWDAAHVTVAQEHFASNFFLARLLPMARGWDHGLGPRALLACPPDEQHVIGLIAFGIALHQRGWRITYLGADTPISVIVDAAEQLSPDQVVIAISHSDVTPADALREQVAARWPLALAGPGATIEDSALASAARLDTDPATASLSHTLG